jgi:hypothetical protein
MSAAAPVDAERLALLTAEALGARRPAEALCLRLDGLLAEPDDAAALAAALFEACFYQLPPFAADWLPLLAMRAYERLGAGDAAALLAALAVQVQPGARAVLPAYRLLRAHFQARGHAAEAGAVAARLRVLAPGESADEAEGGAGDDAAADTAREIVDAPGPSERLLAALERLEREADWAGSARLFEAVWHRVPPIAEYWVYFRMMRVYAALDRTEASALMAALAVQIEPDAPASREAFQRLYRRFTAQGRRHDAAVLLARYALAGPPAPLPDAHEAVEAASLPRIVLPRPPGRHDRMVHPEEALPPQDWRCYGAGVPAGLRELRTPRRRPALRVAEIHDAEVLTWEDAVAVIAADGTPLLDLSVRCFPALLQRRMAQRRTFGLPEDHATLDLAVLANDEFPPPNVCHFLADHASRVALYRAVGVDLGQATVLGPELVAEYQRETATRLGIGAWRSTHPPARLRVKRLFVASNCRHVAHPAHWGAPGVVSSVRALFDLAPREPRRRLYVSRADVSYRRIANEPEVVALLTAHGFEVIVPGQLPFAGQVAAFRDASHVVGPHGGAFGNLIFCAPGTRVLEVFHPQYGTWAYAMLAGPLWLDYASMVARDAESDAAEFNDPDYPLATRNAHSGRDMRVDLDALRRWLADVGA